MTDPRLDEDGRCRLTDLLPSECGCAAHRGGEVISLEEKDHPLSNYYGVFVSRFISSRYEGKCALYPHNHVIAIEELIGFAVKEKSGEEIGWVCQECCEHMMNS